MTLHNYADVLTPGGSGARELWKRCLDRLAKGLEDPKRRFNPAYLGVVIAFLKMNDVRVTKAGRSAADALRSLRDSQETLLAMSQPFGVVKNGKEDGK